MAWTSDLAERAKADRRGRVGAVLAGGGTALFLTLGVLMGVMGIANDGSPARDVQALLVLGLLGAAGTGATVAAVMWRRP